MQTLFDEFPWLPNQSHLGYLDILNETGIVGISIFIIMLIYYFRNLSMLKKEHFWKWFIIITLIINFTESTLFGPHMLTGILFIFSYIALYVESVKVNKRDNISYDSY
jgi:hypothetical protein